MMLLRPLIALLIAAHPAAASVRMMSVAPAKVRAPVQALNTQLAASFTMLQLPAVTPGLTAPTLADAARARVASAQAAPAQSAAAIAPDAAAQIPAAASGQIEKAAAVSRRLIRAGVEADPRGEQAKINRAAADDEAPKDRREALAVLRDVAAVFEDYSLEEIDAMPLEELGALAGAVIEQRRARSDPAILAGYHAAPILARKRAAGLLAARGREAPKTIYKRGGKIDSFDQQRTQEVPKELREAEPRVLRHYTDKAGWRRIVETATLKNGIVPYVRMASGFKQQFDRLAGVFLTSAEQAPEYVGVDRGNAWYVDIALPRDMPLLEIEENRILLLPLPKATPDWVKKVYDKFIGGERQSSWEQKTAEEVAANGGVGPDVHVPIRVVAAGRLGDEAPRVSLKDLHHMGQHLYRGERRLEFVGAGEWGRVYVHPENPGAVVKLSVMSAMAALSMAATDAQAFDADHRMSLRLAEAGAGPKVLAAGRVRGEPTRLSRKFWGLFGKTPKVGARYALAKERVFGKTVSALIQNRAFDDREYQLVRQMLDRLAAAGLKPGDLRLDNIMIGTTAADPEPKAYVIDGGGFHPVAPGTGEQELRAQLDEILVHSRFVPGVDRQPAEQILEPLDLLLRRGVRRSEAKTPLQRLKAAVVYRPPVK